MILTISTRGFYDLLDGKKLKNNSYNLYPKSEFVKIQRAKEFTIFIHGLRNNRKSAKEKFIIAKRRLASLGYKHPLVGFTYDSNTKGAHLKKYEQRALYTGQKIAKHNGKNLAYFISDFTTQYPDIKIRLMGHSLGSTVIISTIENLVKMKKPHSIKKIYLFGASIPDSVAKSVIYRNMIKKTVLDGIVNYYSPTDEVLKYAHDKQQIARPLGLFGLETKNEFIHKKLHPINHRFVSYSEKLESYP